MHSRSMAALALLAACTPLTDLTGARGDAGGAADGGDTLDGGRPPCEADLKTSLQNCGACGNVCDPRVNGVPVCVDGVCGVQCNAGFGDCDGNAVNGCEVDLRRDAAHCGRCDRDCRGGTCRDGACTAVTLTTGQPEPRAIAVTANDVVWLVSAWGFEPAKLRACDLGTCNPTRQLAWTNVDSSGPLAVDGADVFFFSGNGRLERCALASCTDNPQTLAIAGFRSGTGSLAIDGATVSATNDDAQVGRVAKDGGAPALIYADLLSNPRTWAIATDGVRVFFTFRTSGAMMSCPVTGCDGGAPTQHFTGQGQSRALAASAGYLAWIDDRGAAIRSCPIASCSGTPTLVAGAQPQATSLVAAGTQLYWTVKGEGGAIRTCPVTGCGGPPVELLGGQGQPHGLAVTASDVYFTGYESDPSNGYVRRVAR